MSKIKMRCITCGKWFQSANAKEVTCPDCVQKARKEKSAMKNAPPVANKPAGAATQGANSSARPAPPKPKPVQSGTNQWLDKLEDVKIGQPDQPPPRPKLPSPPVQQDPYGGSGPSGYRGERGPGGYRDDRGSGGYRGERGPGTYRDDRGPGGPGAGRGPGAYRDRMAGPSGAPATPGQRPPYPRQPMEGGPARGPYKPAGARGGPKGKPKPPAPPKPKREKTPPPEPFKPTDEQIKQVEERYLELAQPSEFDGIRTQIAHELTIPKKAVKKIIKDLRARQDIPSWWEIQIYKGSAEELAKIKSAYEPYLPVPPVGVHKTIAEQLSLKPGTVYQAIKTIRQELNLPQYNDPTFHEEELALIRARANAKRKPAGKSVETAETGDKPSEAAQTGEVDKPVEAAQAEEVEDKSAETTEVAETKDKFVSHPAAAEPAPTTRESTSPVADSTEQPVSTGSTSDSGQAATD